MQNPTLLTILLGIAAAAAIYFFVVAFFRKRDLNLLKEEHTNTVKERDILEKQVAHYESILNPSLFSLKRVETLQENLEDPKKFEGFPFRSGDSTRDDLKKVISQLAHVLFEQFITNLPLKPESFDRIIDSKHKFRPEIYGVNSEPIRKKVLEIVKVHTDTLMTGGEVDAAYKKAEQNPFFQACENGWQKIFTARAGEIYKKDVRDMLEDAAVFLNEENPILGQVASKILSVIEIIEERSLISAEDKTEVVQLLKPYFERLYALLLPRVDESSTFAKYHFSLKSAQERLFPAMENAAHLN